MKLNSLKELDFPKEKIFFEQIPEQDILSNIHNLNINKNFLKK
jgi:hypothetical protein